MSLNFWVEALQYAIHLINISPPTTTLNFLSPHEALYNQHPSYTSIRTFGCLCYPNLIKHTIPKSLTGSLPYIFLGFSSHHKGFRCLNPKNNRVYISPHVRFSETVFPYVEFYKHLSTPSQIFPSNFNFNNLLPSHVIMQPLHESRTTTKIGSILLPSTNTQTQSIYTPSATNSRTTTPTNSRTTTPTNSSPPPSTSMLLVPSAVVPSSPPTVNASPLPFPPSSILLNPSEYQQLVGALQYLCITRPNITYAVNLASQYMHSPTTVHMIAAKHILHYLSTTKSHGLLLRASTSLNLLARSSTEAEYRCLASAIAELTWIHLLCDVFIVLPNAPVAYCDNIAATYLAYNPVMHSRTKHISIDYHFVHEKVAVVGALKVVHVPTHARLLLVVSSTRLLPIYVVFDQHRFRENVRRLLVVLDS
ncbi:hypothetical protein LIER_24499 [Lithospermum erythrorhizon]|uniref:Retroviral polymerase SH3-like domain-containing protein n=1 Tax=Lithospermum erythrorhizon TaxID=34254 RepID=A0AAV3R768_LITER